MVGECAVSIVSADAPQNGLNDSVNKETFYEDLLGNVSKPSEKIIVSDDLNGHVGCLVAEGICLQCRLMMIMECNSF